MKVKLDNQSGAVNGWMIGTIAAVVLFLIAGSLAIYMYVLYNNQKTDVDGKIDIAVAKATSEQSEIERKRYNEEAKNPRVEFVSPSEYGRVSFMYPKNWSVFVQDDGSDRKDYKAFLHPGVVPPTETRGRNSVNRFALRLEVLNTNFDRVLEEYSKRLEDGDIRSSSVEYNGNSATRLDGLFDDEIRGSVVLMRVRDKTIRLSTDADTFKPDFADVLDTVSYQQ